MFFHPSLLSLPPPGTWRCRGGKRQGSTDSYTVSSNSVNSEVSVYSSFSETTALMNNREIRASSLSLSSSTTRHSSEDEDLILLMASSSNAVDMGPCPRSMMSQSGPLMNYRSATTMGLPGHHFPRNLSKKFHSPVNIASNLAASNNLPFGISITHFAKCNPRITNV